MRDKGKVDLIKVKSIKLGIKTISQPIIESFIRLAGDFRIGTLLFSSPRLKIRTKEKDLKLK